MLDKCAYLACDDGEAVPRAEAEAAVTAIKIDPTGWGSVGDVYTPPHRQALIDAVIAGRQVDLEYESPRSGVSSRRVSPLGLVTKRNVWYLVANTAKGLRTFRLSRVRSATERTDPVDRPSNFDLEAEWDRIITEVEAMRSEIEAQIVVEPHVVRALRYQFGDRITFAEPRPDGRSTAVIRELGVRPLAAQLACHGSAIEVTDPSRELRAEFVRIATELSEVWLQPS